MVPAALPFVSAEPATPPIAAPATVLFSWCDMPEKLQAALGQPFVIEDKPGGGSIVGTDSVAKSAPDGYTLLMMSNTHTVNESLIPERPFQLMRDFVPVAPVNYSDLVLVVHPSVPANTLREFIALAKAKPGALNYASSGPGTPYHMAGELFKAMAGVDEAGRGRHGHDARRIRPLPASGHREVGADREDLRREAGPVRRRAGAAR